MTVGQSAGDPSPDSEAAIAAVRARAVRERTVHRARVERLLEAEGLSADVGALCRSALEQARVTLNFHPDRLIADGRSVAEVLRDEGAYRSQFETGISNGGLTAYPGGDRDEWERRLFAGAYHPPAACGPITVRPKYGGLNLAGFSNGAAPAFGSCTLVLGAHETGRTTFLCGDSNCERYEDIGTADAFEPVLAALLARVAATGHMLGLPGRSLRECVSRLSGTAQRPPVFSRVVDDYIETHTHGPISLASDAEALRLDPSFKDTPTAAALLQAAERYRLTVRWHEGSQLTRATFPTATPVDPGQLPTRWQQFLLSGRARAARRAGHLRVRRRWPASDRRGHRRCGLRVRSRTGALERVGRARPELDRVQGPLAHPRRPRHAQHRHPRMTGAPLERSRRPDRPRPQGPPTSAGVNPRSSHSRFQQGRASKRGAAAGRSIVDRNRAATARERRSTRYVAALAEHSTGVSPGRTDRLGERAA